MAVMRVARALPAAADHATLTAALGEAPARAESVSAGGSTKPLTRAEWQYTVLAVCFVAIGALAGILLDDSKRPPYAPPDGVSVFALFYIAAQAIERFLEPFSHFFGATTASGDAPTGTANVVTKSMAVKGRDSALALTNPTEAAKQAAWWQEMLDQIRQNTATLWAAASMIGMILSGWLGLLLLHAVHAPHAPRGLDIVITGLVLGAGTKPLHDLISNIQVSKDQKQNPTESGGSS